MKPKFLWRCGLIAPALLVLNGNPETVYINLIGLIYIFTLILIFKLWKRK
jgi:hypothetical protein